LILEWNTTFNTFAINYQIGMQNGFDLSSYNFNCYTSQNAGITYLEDDTSDHTYFRAILELSNKIEQLT